MLGGYAINVIVNGIKITPQYFNNPFDKPHGATAPFNRS
jgi:hypothetical protein